MTMLAISACTSSKQEINLPSDDSLAIEKVMHEGRLLRTELLKQNGEKFYVERVAFKGLACQPS